MRHIVYRSERLRTTWKFRISVVALLLVAAWLTSGWWTVALARGLVCESTRMPSDAILLENFDGDYLVFERATELRRQGVSQRVLVPVRIDRTSQPNSVALGTARVMADIAHLGPIEIVPIREVEPISLNAARDIGRFLAHEHVRSVVVVSPYFRSRRSALIYAATLGAAGIRVTCEPAQGSYTIESWTGSLHGMQSVLEQWVKLQYYRLYVLPFRTDG